MSTIMTLNAAQEIENAEIHMLSSRLRALQALAENPMQVQMKKFGSATAFSSKIIAGPAFNTVKGITNTDELDEIISYYQSLHPLKVQLNYFNIYLKKAFTNPASIPLYIVYREKIHPFFLLTFQYANLKKMNFIFLQTYMYVDLT